MREIRPKELQLNPFTRIGDDWPLVTAGTKENGYNTMTVSWGGLGSLWKAGGGLPVATVYIRPQRYTKEFIDREDYFSISFLPKEYKKQLGLLGSKSGRDGDKIAEAGLTPAFDEHTTYFAESELVLICRKLYHAPILEEGFADRTIIDSMYPEHDFHEMYIGEVVRAYVAD